MSSVQVGEDVLVPQGWNERRRVPLLLCLSIHLQAVAV